MTRVFDHSVKRRFRSCERGSTAKRRRGEVRKVCAKIERLTPTLVAFCTRHENLLIEALASRHRVKTRALFHDTDPTFATSDTGGGSLEKSARKASAVDGETSFALVQTGPAPRDCGTWTVEAVDSRRGANRRADNHTIAHRSTLALRCTIPSKAVYTARCI